MRPEDFRDQLRHEPFQPFRVTLTDGRRYDVRYPEMAMVGRSNVAIGLAEERKQDSDAEPIFDRMVTVSLNHVMKLQAIEGSAPQRA